MVRPMFSGRLAPPLNRHLGHAREGPAPLVRVERGVPDHVGLGVSREGQVRLHRHPPVAVQREAQGAQERRGLHPGGPQRGARLDGLPVLADAYLGGGDGRDHGPGTHLHAQTLQLLDGAGGELLREGGEHPGASFEEDDPGLRRVDGAEVVLERLAGDLGQGPGQLHPGRPRSNHDERQQCPAHLRVLLPLRLLVGQEDPASDLQGVVDPLQAGRQGGPLVLPEVGVGRPGGQDQVGRRGRTRPPAAPHRPGRSMAVTSPRSTSTLG